MLKEEEEEERPEVALAIRILAITTYFEVLVFPKICFCFILTTGREGETYSNQNKCRLEGKKNGVGEINFLPLT